MRRVGLVGRLFRDVVRPTWSGREPCGELEPPPQPAPQIQSAIPDGVIANYLEHRFDLLGSGWTRVAPGMHCRGLEGFRYSLAPSHASAPGAGGVNLANRRDALRLRNLLPQDYHPIDWQLDFKSGYRWSERSWYRRVRTAPAPGADIKVPWELSRMQHLPQLALAYGQAGSAWYRGEALAFEFRNQVLDFIAANPPAFGVNWKSTMEVGIRAANWVLAHWLFVGYGARFDEPFSRVLRRSLREHGRHIARNLEWMRGERANHYLGNIAGLVFCAAALPRTPETDAWLIFGAQELVREVEFQFLEDGAHFEGSTAYHRFSLGLVVHPAAVLLGLAPDRLASLRRRPPFRLGGRPASWPGRSTTPADETESPFPGWWRDRLARAMTFLEDLRGPDGALVQLGDNDSGSLFKLSPVYHRTSVAAARGSRANLQDYEELPGDAEYWMEDVEEVRSTLAATRALLSATREADAPGEQGASEAVVRWLSRGRSLSAGSLSTTRGDAVTIPEGGQTRLPQGHGDQPGQVRVFRTNHSDLTQDLTFRPYPRFGCFVYRSAHLFLVVRAWSRAPRYTAHLHSDQLGVVLWLDGVEVIRDPGTFVYTPLPGERNRYRGVHAHDTPWPSGMDDPAALDPGPFSLRGVPPATILRADATGFLGCYQARGVVVSRRIDIGDDAVTITDRPRLPGAAERRPPAASPGYGIRERSAE